ncbi:hypothetical protein NDU88_006890 [Pleurodeles waltl]|uniref:SAP domain-containing protein n=1 Tax=Pleurodeles waltl TaxID=8319 RepID=A0AAV7NUF3_PLEWA|nr:hypothetical protein NDU88_006890 [Pleurodeles waltl]
MMQHVRCMELSLGPVVRKGGRHRCCLEMDSSFTEDYNESDLVHIESPTKAGLRELCKDRGLNVSKRSSKQELQDAFVAFEEARWKEDQAAKDQKGDVPEEEEQNDLAVAPEEKREPTESEFPTGS